MSESIGTIVEKLCKITETYPINWNNFDKVLSEIDNINIIDEEYEETILSQYLSDSNLYHQGHIIPFVFKRFIEAGYNVCANNGKNGVLPLSQLCWASYDKYILDAARILLDAGSPIMSEGDQYNPDEDDDPPGVLGSISWKVSGAWMVDKDYDWANTLEAYWNLINAYKDGKNYNSIDFYDKCIGLELTGAESVANNNGAPIIEKNGLYHFPESLIFWFGKTPLVLSRYMDIKIDGVYTEDKKDSVFDVSAMLAPVIGAKLKKIQYIDVNTYYLLFDNDVRLLFTHYDAGEHNYVGMFAIQSDFPDVCTSELSIREIRLRKGKTYADRVVCYDEESVAIICDNEAYMLYSLPTNAEEAAIYIANCPKEFLREFTRKLPVVEIRSHSVNKTDNSVKSVWMSCNEGYLYFGENGSRGIEVILFKITPEEINTRDLYRNDGAHMDFIHCEVDFDKECKE